MAADTDDDTMEWPAEMAAPKSARVLSQAEIDSLLGDGPGEARGADEDQSGMERLLDTTQVSYERLPMLEIVFDRLVRSLTSSLRNFTSDNVEVEIDSTQTMRFGSYLNALPLPAMLAVFKVEQWDNYGLLVIDSALIYSMVDVLLGGRQGAAIMRIEGRPYTSIERSLIARLIEVVLVELSSSFEPLAPVQFKFERLEVNPRFATITRMSNAAVLARLRVDMEDRGGRIDLLLPYATLEPVRELLLQQFMGERLGRDRIWETHLAEGLLETEVQLEAVLDEQVMPLSKVMQLEVGSQILLETLPGALVQLRCGTIPLFKAKAGHLSSKVAVRIETENRRMRVSRPAHAI